MAWAFWQHPVSPPRSSNRTCGFPASGFPTGFIARHTVDGQFGLVSRDDTVARTHLRLATERVRTLPNLTGVARLIANHRSFACSQACRKSGSFAPPALPSFNARTTLSDPRQACRALEPGVLTKDSGGTAAGGRQTRRSAQRDAGPSGKRFDAGCRPLAAALRVVPGGPPASSKASTVGACYAFRSSPSGSTPPGTMTPLSLVRIPGWRLGPRKAG